MKKFLFICLVAIVTSACQKTDDVVEIVAINSATDTLIATGTFKRTTKNTSGNVKLYNRPNDYLLVFENFETGSGPDVRIYLAQNASAKPFVNLGSLTKEGTFSLTFAKNVDVSSYKFICIWCEPFTQIFGTAELQFIN